MGVGHVASRGRIRTQVCQGGSRSPTTVLPTGECRALSKETVSRPPARVLTTGPPVVVGGWERAEPCGQGFASQLCLQHDPGSGPFFASELFPRPSLGAVRLPISLGGCEAYVR